jgi:hypothetical protein
MFGGEFYPKRANDAMRGTNIKMKERRNPNEKQLRHVKAFSLMDHFNVVTNHQSRGLVPFCIANLFMVTFLLR